MAVNRPYLRCEECKKRKEIFALSLCKGCDINIPEKDYFDKDENIVYDEDE